MTSATIPTSQKNNQVGFQIALICFLYEKNLLVTLGLTNLGKILYLIVLCQVLVPWMQKLDLGNLWKLTNQTPCFRPRPTANSASSSATFTASRRKATWRNQDKRLQRYGYWWNRPSKGIFRFFAKFRSFPAFWKFLIQMIVLNFCTLRDWNQVVRTFSRLVRF